MRVSKQLGTIITAAAVAGVMSFGAGAVIAAGASGSSVTYQACLSSKGALSKVSSSVTPTCPSTSTLISWNSQGATGAPGAPGATGATGATGASGAIANTCTSPPGPNLNFSTCDLTNFQWPFVILTGDNMVSTNLWHAYLANAHLDQANLTNADLITANLTNADLTSADLTNADLSGANLGGASLNFANLTNALLGNAKNFSFAHLAFVTWNNTTCPDGSISNSHTPNSCIGH